MRVSRSDDAALIERLRHEASLSRPAFDAAAADRVIAAVRGGPTLRYRVRRAWSAVACVGCLGAVCGGMWLGERLRPAAEAGVGSGGVAVASVPGLDALPTLDELGADVAGGIGSLAATVVGLPDWRDLAVADLPIVDAWRFDGEAGFVAAPDGSADPGPTR